MARYGYARVFINRSGLACIQRDDARAARNTHEAASEPPLGRDLFFQKERLTQLTSPNGITSDWLDAIVDTASLAFIMSLDRKRIIRSAPVTFGHGKFSAGTGIPASSKRALAAAAASAENRLSYFRTRYSAVRSPSPASVRIW